MEDASPLLKSSIHVLERVLSLSSSPLDILEGIEYSRSNKDIHRGCAGRFVK